MIWYPWLDTVYLQILEAYRSGRGHHFLLIHSNGNGEDVLIHRLTRWLMCAEPIDIESCDECCSCRLFDSNCHPDCYQLGLEDGSHSIGIEQVRILSEKLYQYAYVSQLKVLYIKNSEWLTDEATNALLKIFEEPPSRVYFFLKCSDFTRLLPTFLSRCLRWTIYPPIESVSLQWLCKQNNIVSSAQEAIAALRLSCGAPLSAYSILKLESWKLRSKLCKNIRSIINNNNFLSMLSLFKKYENENKMLIRWLCSLLIDVLKWQQGLDKFLVNVDQINLIKDVAFKYSSLVLSNQLQQWLTCLYYLEKFPHINQKSLFVYQLLNIEGNVMNFSRV